MADKLTRDDSTPADAVTYRAPDGTVFLAPPAANFPAIYAYGKLIASRPWDQQRDAVGAAVSHFGFYDFQRHDGVFYPAYTDASNYAVGIVMNGAGYSWLETESIAGGFALWSSSQGWTSRQTAWWYYGFTAAESGHLPLPPGPTLSHIYA